MQGRILNLSLDLTVIPPQGDMVDTGAAFELGEKLALEIGLLAQRLAPEGSRVEVERQITAY